MNKYTKEQFEYAVANSSNIAEALRKLDLSISGAAYASFYNSIKKWNVDFSHFISSNSKWAPKHNALYHISNETTIRSCKLKNKLIKEGYLEPRCSNCLRTEWLDVKIPLELDHINGNHKDNRLENLRILCPNCHALTDTHSGKNITKKYGKLEYNCIDCKVLVSRNSKRCMKCNAKTRMNANHTSKINWPSIEELLSYLETMSYLELSKKLGVSDNAIRKHIKKRQ